MNPEMCRPVLPWWRVPMVWLVIGGPAVVVVASIATLTLAVRGADIPLLEKRQVPLPQAGAMAPATQARNHAATERR